MAKTIHSSFSGHTLFVKKVEVRDLPPNLDYRIEYAEFWVVKNWGDDGVTFMYLGRGNPAAPKQIVAWYRNGKMWSSFGTTLQATIEGAQKDGWLYA